MQKDTEVACRKLVAYSYVVEPLSKTWYTSDSKLNQGADDDNNIHAKDQ